MERLFQMCSQKPLPLDSIRDLLLKKQYTAEQLTQVVIRHFRENCWCETQDFESEYGRLPQRHEVFCTSLYDLLGLFLEFGLDPNISYEHETVLSAVLYIDYHYDAADAARLLLESGADPNAIADQQFEESAFEQIDCDVIFGALEQEDRRVYDSWVHAWLVMVGFGAKTDIGAVPVKMKEGYSVEIFREHERFDFTIEMTKASRDGWIMHIFEKETGREVAEL